MNADKRQASADLWAESSIASAVNPSRETAKLSRHLTHVDRRHLLLLTQPVSQTADTHFTVVPRTVEG